MGFGSVLEQNTQPLEQIGEGKYADEVVLPGSEGSVSIDELDLPTELPDPDAVNDFLGDVVSPEVDAHNFASGLDSEVTAEQMQEQLAGLAAYYTPAEVEEFYSQVEETVGTMWSENQDILDNLELALQELRKSAQD